MADTGAMRQKRYRDARWTAGENLGEAIKHLCCRRSIICAAPIIASLWCNATGNTRTINNRGVTTRSSRHWISIHLIHLRQAGIITVAGKSKGFQHLVQNAVINSHPEAALIHNGGRMAVDNCGHRLYLTSNYGPSGNADRAKWL